MKKILIIVCLFMVIFIKNIYADTKTDMQQFFNNLVANFEKINLLVDKNKKEEEILKLSNNVMDLNWISNFILGKFRNSINDKQKTEFIYLYSKFLIKNYISILDIYKKDSYKILSIEQQKENIFIVQTSVKYDNSEIKNSFRIIKNKEQYFITDIITEGVSFISAQRSEINSILGSKGIDNFLEELRNKNATN